MFIVPVHHRANKIPENCAVHLQHAQPSPYPLLPRPCQSKVSWQVHACMETREDGNGKQPPLGHKPGQVRTLGHSAPAITVG
mmetsp:Transcript_87692/g.146197  ORF Transcript_87692/g.146197 Transcript_87692/m.146197 type:complete len:82 (-) Transcript_87692:1507-1752(-)